MACATFNVHAEVSPIGYGFNFGGGVSYPLRYGAKDVKFTGTNKFVSADLNARFHLNLFFEYAFTNYIGCGLEAGYMKKRVGLTGESPTSSSGDSGDSKGSRSSQQSITINQQGIVVPMYLYIYPCGREENEGVFKIALGCTHYFPLQSTYMQDDNNEVTLSSSQKDERRRYEPAATLGIAYEFDFGLLFGAKYSYGILNKFNKPNQKAQSIFTNINSLKRMHDQCVFVNIGYNLAGLFAE